MQRKYTGNLWIAPPRTTRKKHKRAKVVKDQHGMNNFILMLPQPRIVEADTCEVETTMVLPQSSIEMTEEEENENADSI